MRTEIRGRAIDLMGFGKATKAVVIGLPVFLVCVTLMSLIWNSISGHGHLTLSVYSQLFQNESFFKIIGATLESSIGGALLSVLIGAPMAYVAASMTEKYVKWFHVANSLPLIIPSYISALAWEFMFGPIGFVNKILSHIFGGNPQVIHFFGMGGLIFSLGLIHYPFVYLLTYAALSQIPVDSLRAARCSGASAFSVFRYIIFPLGWQAILNGALLAFVTNADDFGIPAFIGIPGHVTVLSTAIYQEITNSLFSGGFGSAAAWSVIAGVISGFIMLLEVLASRRTNHYSSGQSGGLRGNNMAVSVIGIALFVLILLITVVIPFILLVITALLPAVGAPLSKMSISDFWIAIENFGQTGLVFRNSIEMALVTGVACSIVGSIAVNTFSKNNSLFGKFVGIVLSLPYALPGMIFGLAMILTFLHPLPLVHWSLYGTFWILVIAYFTRFITLAVRTLTPAFASFDRTQVRAASVCGAGTLKVVQRILIPAMLTSFITSFLFVFLTSLTEMTVSSVLAAPKTETIGMAILNFDQTGDMMSAAVFSLMVLALMGVFAAVVWGCMKAYLHINNKKTRSALHWRLLRNP
jgi:iron(III) transport system permease protein